MIKIAVSCCTDEELNAIIKMFSPYARKIKTPKFQRGKYLKTYIFIDHKSLLK